MPLFNKPYVDWTEAQKDLYYWLQFYDMVYDKINNQWYVSEIDVFKPYMVKYDIAVDCFMAWYSRKMEEKRLESNKPKEQQSDYEVVGRPAHY